MGFYEKDFIIRFFEVDENNRLSVTGLMQMLQEIAGMHSAQVGYGLNNLEETGLAWFLLYWKIKIFEKPRWNTKLHIKTWPRTIERVHSFRDFEIYDEKNNKIAIAASKWALLDVKKNSVTRIPAHMEEEYGCIDKSVFDTPVDTKLNIPKNITFSYEYTIQRRDIDTNHHVNNLCYLDFAYQALPEDIYYNTDFTEIEILYKKQIKINETIKCFYCEQNDYHIVVIKNEDLSCIHAVIKLK